LDHRAHYAGRNPKIPDAKLQKNPNPRFVILAFGVLAFGVWRLAFFG
jgi:hypothetical protein